MPATAPRDYPASSDHIAQTSTTGASQHRTAAAGPDRPTLAFAPTSLIKIGDRIRVVGEVRNTSALPACLGLEASAFIGDTNAAQQRMGTLGAHRLHPGETRPDSIEFEGVLRLQDANISAGYNPEFFRLPEFEDVPDRVTLRAISQYCDLNQTLAPTLSDIRIVQDTDGTPRLTTSVENTSTITASVVKITATYYDAYGYVKLVTPHWIETNLIPGESRIEYIPLMTAQNTVQLANLNDISLNGRVANTAIPRPSARLKLPQANRFDSVSISIEIMPIEPTF